MFRKLFRALWITAFIVLFTLMTINSFKAKEWDFTVFYRTAEHLWNGEPVYSFARDLGNSYKYPPWITPLFLPMVALSENTASILWRLIQTASALYVVYWCAARTRYKMAAITAAVVFYGIFMMNILAGQIQLFLLALSLGSYSVISKKPTLGFFGLWTGFSAKIFNLFSLFGLPEGSIRRKSVIKTAIICVLLSLPVLHGFKYDVIAALRAFVETTNSRTGNVLGATNGFPQFWIFLFDLNVFNAIEAWLAFGLSLISVSYLFYFLIQKIENPIHVYAIALAMGAVIHPLAFGYTFAWTYPLAVFAIEKIYFDETPAPHGGIKKTLGIIAFLLLNFYNSGFVASMDWHTPMIAPRAIGAMILSVLLCW